MVAQAGSSARKGRGTFLRLQVYQGQSVGNSPIEVYERVEKSII